MTLAQEYARRLRQDSDIVDHLAFLYETVCRYPGARVVELGIRQGNSTTALLAGAEMVNGHVWSCDIAPPERPERLVVGSNVPWSWFLGDDLSQAARDWLPLEVDVLFLDTSHEYEHTLDELRTYMPRVVPGGTVLCHDTEWTYEHGAPEDGPPFPVAAALDTYCKETGMTWTNRPGCFGLGVMVR